MEKESAGDLLFGIKFPQFCIQRLNVERMKLDLTINEK
jgi:hypothetical protein